MAMLSRGPAKDVPYDGESQLSQYQRRVLGDMLNENFPKLRKVRAARCIFVREEKSPLPLLLLTCRVSPLAPQDIDLADNDIKRIQKIQKYMKDNGVSGIQNQMKIACALKQEGVLSDRVWYTLHTLIAGNAMAKDLKDPFKALMDPVNQKKK